MTERMDFADGKYTVINENGKFFISDNLIYWMLMDVMKLLEERDALAAKLVERTKEACVKACMDEAGKWPYPSHGNAAASMCAKMIFDMRQK